MGFQTPQFTIGTLLDWAATGKLQLPDFQRSFRWDDERIRQLLVTILRGHPMGVVMILQTGGDQVRFGARAVEGALANGTLPQYLLLDGQQRLTSLFQSLTADGVADTVSDKGQKLKRRYFVDISKALGSAADQDAAVRSIPWDSEKNDGTQVGLVTTNFGRDVVLDVSTRQAQIDAGLMPFTALFDGTATGWLLEYMQAGGQDELQHRSALFAAFNQAVVTQVTTYQIPAIELDNETTKEAVATVFEKVNTGGLALDVFELLTATFAGDLAHFREHGKDFRLREDWEATEKIVANHPALDGLQRTDFLQAITLLSTLSHRAADEAAGKLRPAATSARREDMLQLELADYIRWADAVRAALPWVADFYTAHHIHTARDVPYRTQTVPLVVLRVLLGKDIDLIPVARRISRWYWCGVFGELYGSTTESRFARDVEQVPAWARAGTTGQDVPEPVTVREANLVESRLMSLRTRLSAAYKGVYALLMANGCRDWLEDKVIDHASFTQLQVDIHHIFPKAWCDREKVDVDKRESIVNKTPLSKTTNIFLRGDSPTDYVRRLEARAVASEELDGLLRPHLVDPSLLRAADFEAFLRARREALSVLISSAMGKEVIRDIVVTDGVEHGLEDASAFVPEPEELIDDSLEEA